MVKNEIVTKKRSQKVTFIIEKFAEIIFLISACFSVLSVAIISVYLFTTGTPAIGKIGLFQFLFGGTWAPSSGQFGIAPMLVGSLILTAASTCLSVVIGLFTGIFMATIAPEYILKIMRPAVNLLAGIPSVIYGFFGLVIIVPIIRNTFGGSGYSILAGVIILSIMILPTIISTTETALRAVPPEYKEGSLGLGATKIQTIFKIIVPAAKSGILSGVVLGIGRAVGETMAIILVTANRALFPTSILDPIRTMTAGIALEMGYSSGLHREALFGIGVVLFVFILSLNIFLQAITRKRKES